MARPKAADHEAQRDRILAAAVRAFSEVGYPSASMAQLALACGTSKAGLYHYYPSKEALLFDALDRYTRRLIALARGIQARALPPRQTVAELVRAFVIEYRSARDHHIALLNDVKFLVAPQRSVIQAQERAVVAVFAEVLARGWPERMAGGLAMPTTMALLGMINFTFAWLRPEGPMSHEQFAELVIGLWERGLSGPAVADVVAGRPAARPISSYIQANSKQERPA